MSKDNPAHHSGAPDLRPEAQRDEEHGGAVKRPQQTDDNMAGKDVPRGSEKATHSRK